MESSATINAVSWDLAPEEQALEQMHVDLNRSGVRPLPYPFRSALALTSDIDRSNTRHFRALTGQIVARHGLDFGDSVWLQAIRSGRFSGLGFLSSNYGFWTRQTRPSAGELDHHDLANEYHLGNIDHWHCFLSWGPRFVVLDVKSNGDDGTLVARLPPRRKLEDDPEHGVRYFHLAAIGILHESRDSPEVDRIVVEGNGLLRRRSWTYERNDFGRCERIAGHTRQSSGETTVTFIPLLGELHEDRFVPFLEDVASVSVHLRGCRARSVRNLIIYSTYADVLYDRVATLQRDLGIHMNLLTIHGKWMIPHYKQHSRQRKLFEERRKAARSGKLESLYGSGDLHGVRFSTNADEECSFVRLYPELLTECGIAFWRPTGNGDIFRNLSTSDETRYVDVLDVVTPALRRDGGYIYLLTTTKARPRRKTGDPNHDKKTMAGNFVERCEVILEDFRKQPDRVAVMYTHLGNLAPWNRMRRPYFDERLFVSLRRLCHGIGYDESDGPRLWFTRAGVISDYALLLRQVAGHVERQDGNTVRVRRWTDPYIGTDLPRDARQMYGLTFYVQEPLSARVYLDDTEVTEIVRNPPDETGRGSVTVAACGIGRVVLGGLDPSKSATLGAPSAGGAADYEYRSGEEGGFLRVMARGGAGRPQMGTGNGEGPYGVAISRDDLRVEGAQHLRVTFRRGTSDSRFGVVVCTMNGGRFYFGEAELLEGAGETTASYTYAFSGACAGTWRTVMVPFYDLEWHFPDRADTSTVALPANALERVDVLVAGGGEAYVDVAAIVFARPRTVGPGREKRVVIGGRVTPSGESRVVHLRRTDGIEELEAETVTDGLGGFAFSGMPPGGYALWCGADGRRRWVECLYDRYDVELAAP